MMKYKTYTDTVDKLKEDSNYRFLRDIEFNEGYKVSFNNSDRINFSSNDYLGLARNSEIKKEFYKNKLNIKSEFSSSSSRLLSGNEKTYKQLESYISNWYNRDSTLVFSSGYHINSGVIPAIASKGDLILSDKLNHASIVDGVRLSTADVFRYRHLDYAQLEKYLEKNAVNYNNIWLITESVFSMDGDFVDVNKLIELKDKYGLYIYLDEAHAVGVIGEQGRGLVEKENVINQIDIITGTFGKALSSYGAFLVCDKIIYEFLINKARTLIFTTALPPVQLQWTLFILEKIPFLIKEREYLQNASKYLRDGLNAKGYKIFGENHIISVVSGRSSDAINKSNQLMCSNLFALAVRPPTVPENSSRIRISLNSTMSLETLDRLIDVF